MPQRKKRLTVFVGLKLFLSRHPDGRIRKSEEVSFARALGLNREECQSHFQFFKKIFMEKELFCEPASIFNVDETDLQLNNKANFVLAERDSKVVSTVISSEIRETISFIACYNAKDTFLPPVVIIKGKYK